MSRRNPVVRHPRLGFSITASDRGYPDFDGAVCPTTDPEIWFYSARDTESEYRVVQNYEIAGSTLGGPYENTYAILASICEQCPVVKECFNYALRYEAHGFWGGSAPEERRRLRRMHNILFKDPYDNRLMDRMIGAIRRSTKEVEYEKSFDTLVHPLDQ